MNISLQMKRVLDSIFYNSERIASIGGIHPSVNFERHTVFNRYLYVPIKDRIEVPIYCKGTINYTIAEYTYTDRAEEVAIPLYVNVIHDSRKTANAIFKALFLSDVRNRLVKISDSKGVNYYGNKCIIINNEGKILFLGTIVADIGGPDKSFYHINKVRIYVHPSVYLHDGTVEKGIIKTLIPYYLENGVRTDNSRYTRVRRDETPNNSNFYIPEIVIADVTDRFLKTPVKPDVLTINEQATKMLQSRLDEIFIGTNLV